MTPDRFPQPTAFTPFAAEPTEDDNEWYTPAHIIALAHFVLGGIALDAASSAEANVVVGAERYFTVFDDALNQEWMTSSPGGVFCNPPYSGSHDLTGKFWRKTRSEFDAARFDAGLFLANAKTETRWFQDALGCGYAALLPAGRLSFWRTGRGSRTGYFGSALVLLSRRLYRDGSPTPYIDDPLSRFLAEGRRLGRVIVSI